MISQRVPAQQVIFRGSLDIHLYLLYLKFKNEKTKLSEELTMRFLGRRPHCLREVNTIIKIDHQGSHIEISKTERNRCSAEFTEKIACGVLKEDSTIAEIAARFNIHPNQVSKWKKQALQEG